ncbi:MAG: Stp1/IreP family PP2C-type Ser/Thr phosphatase [Acutalibacteraceae bacterium]|nr:Stp1/IreP family PP2C-type Ser/Thr phosphatase [Acutalibacteraceae bacterium]
MKLFGKTDIGLVRESNQDAFSFGSFDDGNCWAVVCDGMGGVSGGQIASGICVEKVSEAIKRGYRDKMNLSSAKNLLATAINAANSAVFKEAQENIELKGMGTTVVAVLVLGKLCVIAHVGDSRAYILNEVIKPITKDHSFVQLLIDTGKITEEEAKVHPDRNVITRAVGIEHVVDVEIDVVDINDDDKLLICTDGLNGYVSDADILKVVNINGDSSTEKLVETANNAGGRDNVTVVIISEDVQGE